MADEAILLRGVIRRFDRAGMANRMVIVATEIAGSKAGWNSGLYSYDMYPEDRSKFEIDDEVEVVVRKVE